MLLSAIECVKLVSMRAWVLAAISRFALAYGQFCIRARLAALTRPGPGIQFTRATKKGASLLKEVTLNTSGIC
jgi:hypothetical protein